MDTLTWVPDEAEILDEDGLIKQKIQFGGGYAQVTYKGLRRLWRIRFTTPPASKLEEIYNILGSAQGFLWSQPGERAGEGTHRARSKTYTEHWQNDDLVAVSAEVWIEIESWAAISEAQKKFGPRDTGTDR